MRRILGNPIGVERCSVVSRDPAYGEPMRRSCVGQVVDDGGVGAAVFDSVADADLVVG